MPPPPRRRKPPTPPPAESGIAPIDSRPNEPLRDTAVRALLWARFYGWVGPDFWPVDTSGRQFAFTAPGLTAVDYPAGLPTLPVEGVCPFVAALAMVHGEQEVRAVSGDGTLFDFLIGLGREPR